MRLTTSSGNHSCHHQTFFTFLFCLKECWHSHHVNNHTRCIQGVWWCWWWFFSYSLLAEMSNNKFYFFNQNFPRKKANLFWSKPKRSTFSNGKSYNRYQPKRLEKSLLVKHMKREAKKTCLKCQMFLLSFFVVANCILEKEKFTLNHTFPFSFFHLASSHKQDVNKLKQIALFRKAWHVTEDFSDYETLLFNKLEIYRITGRFI